MLQNHMKNQYHTSQFPRPGILGPGTVFSAERVGIPVETVNLPISICAKTLTTQPRMISHRRFSPPRAPVRVVAISSPLPTMLAAMIKPGPR